MEDKYTKGEKELDEGLAISVTDKLTANPKLEEKPEEAIEAAIFGVGAGGSIAWTPSLYKDKVYFGSCDHCVYCLDMKTGKQVWRFETGDIIMCSPLAHDGVVYSSSYDKKIYALNSENGKAIWNVELDSPIFCSASIQENVICVGSLEGTFYGIDKSEGNILWKFHTG